MSMSDDILDQAAANLADPNACKTENWIAGAKWQQERMYSEEDMIEFAIWVYLEIGSSKNKERTNKELFKEWFEQFKKK